MQQLPVIFKPTAHQFASKVKKRFIPQMYIDRIWNQLMIQEENEQ